MKYKKILLVGSSFLFLLGCSEKSLTKIRQIDVNSEWNTSLKRGNNIRYNETIYSEPLRVYGKELRFFLYKKYKFNDDKLKKIRISIDNIYDKTGKLFAKNNGISDMVFAAFAKLNVFSLNNVLSSQTKNNLEVMENLTFSKKNKQGITVNGFPIADAIRKRPSTLYYLPAGVIRPSRYYISGALLEYDKRKKDKVGFDIKYFSFGTNLDVIDISLDLRVIDSLDGTLAVTEDKKKIPAFISLTNRLVTISRDGEFFKVIDSDPYGLKVSSNIGDPTLYALREIVELAVLELVSKFTGFDWKKSSAPKFVAEKSTFSQFVIKKDK